MTQKPSSNGSSLPKVRSKDELIRIVERIIALRPDCSVIDLDNLSHIQSPPNAQLGIWLDSWHDIVNALGSYDDAKVGIEIARDILYLASCRLENLIFSADGTKPPLDQFGPPGRGLKMLFEASTCYTSVVPIALYRGRVVYWGSNPAVKWTDEECRNENVRCARMSITKNLI